MLACQKKKKKKSTLHTCGCEEGEGKKVKKNPFKLATSFCLVFSVSFRYFAPCLGGGEGGGLSGGGMWMLVVPIGMGV